MDADLDTLCTAVYFTADDLLPSRPANARRRVTDAEVVTLAVAQAVMGIPSDRRFLAVARRLLGHLFPHLPRPVRPTTSAAARLAETIDWLVGVFAAQSPGFRRRPGAAGLDPGRVRPLARDRPPLGPGRLGRLRLVPQPLALLLGHAPAPGLRPRRHAAGGRASPAPTGATSARWPSSCSCRGPARRRDGRRRQGLCRARLRGRRGRTRARAWCARPARRARPRAPPGAHPPAHRVGLPDLQGPAHPRAPRRPHPRGACGPASPGASWPSPPASGSTTSSGDRAARWSTTWPERVESII